MWTFGVVRLNLVMLVEEEEEETEEGTTPKRKPEPKPKIITKVIRKPKPGAVKPVEEEEDILEPLPTWDDDDDDPITYVDDMDNFLDDGEEGDDF